MKTQIKGIEIKKAVELAKPFVGDFKKKSYPRSILKTSLITPEYVIATDSHRLIRIKHNGEVIENTLHHYKKEITGECLPSSYPETSRLIPDPYSAQKEVKINVAEWLEAHELGLIAAKEHKNKVIHLKGYKFMVNAVKTFINKKGKEEKQPDFEQITYTYTLDHDTEIEKVSYNCEYMLQALKVFKKMKIQEITLYFYGPLRPFLLIGDDIEIIILPVRTNV